MRGLVCQHSIMEHLAGTLPAQLQSQLPALTPREEAAPGSNTSKYLSRIQLCHAQWEMQSSLALCWPKPGSCTWEVNQLTEDLFLALYPSALLIKGKEIKPTQHPTGWRYQFEQFQIISLKWKHSKLSNTKKETTKSNVHQVRKSTERSPNSSPSIEAQINHTEFLRTESFSFENPKLQRKAIRSHFYPSTRNYSNIQ